ncbi:MAG: hypothetical protein R2845_03595 [Thermomicrobiales bacterium]
MRLWGASAVPDCQGVSVIPRGIVVRSERGEVEAASVIAMEWIGDLTLNDLVRRLVATNDVVRLGGLGTRFMRLKQVLAEHRFSHGSLTPDNILMRRGDAMAIVDYDTAAWPGSPRGRMPNPLPAYRHPSGSAPAVFERRDDFAALVILVSLRALAVDSGMLFPKSLHPEHGMVLSARDLHDPRHSERFRRLSGIDDRKRSRWPRSWLSRAKAGRSNAAVRRSDPRCEAVTGRARRSTRSDTRPIYQI